MDRIRGKILFAVLMSITLHGVFFAFSTHLVLPGMGNIAEQTRKIFRIKDVDKTPEAIELFRENEKITEAPSPEQSVPEIEAISIENSEALEQAEKAIETKKKKTAIEKTEELSNLPQADISTEDLMKPSEKRTKQQTKPDTRALTGAVLSRGPSSLTEAPGISHDETEYEGKEGLGGEMLDVSGSGTERKDVSPGQGVGDSGKSVERVGKYEDITSYLEATVKTFQNPVTREKFFSVHVGVRKGIKIEAMPKDVVFLLDSSKSVTQSRFEHIKKGLMDVLGDLAEKDTFNIVAFKNKQDQFARSSVRATREKILEARAFVNTLTTGERTDIENALLGIIREKPKKKPSYVVLISDGRPTLGMTSSSEIIRTITRMNNGLRPIFSFGAGLRVNTYLLDFISYQNRAWSEFAMASDTAGRDLIKLYQDLRFPIMTDLRYRISGLESEEMFPKELPDFYHAKGLTVYGKYWDEDVFSMQVLGEVDGVVKEMIFKKALSEAEKGTKDIETSWAFSKIYHMIGMETMGQGDQMSLEKGIESLSREYGIETPRFNGELHFEGSGEEE